MAVFGGKQLEDVRETRAEYSASASVDVGTEYGEAQERGSRLGRGGRTCRTAHFIRTRLTSGW